MDFLSNLYDLLLESAPWLVLGLALGGLIKTVFPLQLLNRHFSQSNLSAVGKATLLGAPLPLCSCGVVPAAVGLRQAGASKPATVSFLISTPETGVDSISITYALMGPIMAIARLFSALFSAFFTGLLVLLSGKIAANNKNPSQERSIAHTEASCTSNCNASCGSKHDHHEHEGGHDHNAEDDQSCTQQQHLESKWQKLTSGLKYAFITMYADIVGWLFIGIVFAALVQTYVPATFLTQWGTGIFAMLVMLLIGIPMYVCATASTPIAVGLIMAGISPGVALVFLLSGPATNIGTLGIISKLLGRNTMWLYVIGTASSAIFSGLMLDWLLVQNGWSINTTMTAEHQTLPSWIQIPALLILVFFAGLIGIQKLNTKKSK